MTLFLLPLCPLSKGLAVLLRHAGAELGTTPNIKHIVMGRCYEYSTLVNPGVR